MNSTMKSEVEILAELRDQGYTENMIFQDDKLYINDIGGKGYTTGECTIEKEYRFEGMSNPSDMSIIYALKTSDGKRGTIVVGYGPNGDLDMANFFKDIQDVSHE